MSRTDPTGLADGDVTDDEGKSNQEPEVYSGKTTKGIVKALANAESHEGSPRVYSEPKGDNLVKAFESAPGNGPSVIQTSRAGETTPKYGNLPVNTIDPANGQVSRAQNELANKVAEWGQGNIMVVSPESVKGLTQPAPDNRFTSGPLKGKSFDIMYALEPGASAPEMNKDILKGTRMSSNDSISRTLGNINDHLSKADYVVMDFRNLTPINQTLIENYLNYGECPAPEKVIIVR